MAPRKPKNPIQDIINTTSAWLGGNRGTVNPQVARVSRDLGTVAQTIDTFTGGFGAAAGRDVRNFAQGGSLPTNLAKTAAVNLAAGAAGAKAAQVAGKVLPKVARSVLPTEVGVHHSVAMKGQPFTGAIRGSKAGRSLTAMDQQAGQSYFWSTKGKGGAAKAANEVKFQTEEIAYKYVDFPDESTAMGYVTKIPRGTAKVDPNLPGSTARQVAGGTQKVVKSVPGTGNPFYAVAKSFTDEDVRK